MAGQVRDGRAPMLRIREPEQTRAVVLVMHGGQVHSYRPTRWSHLAVARMRPFVKAVERRGNTDGVAVCSLLFAHRGWNATGAPIDDARWALEEIQTHFGSVPVVLLGHSMGGRTAVRVAGHPLVVGVVGLAPWLPAGEPVEQLAHRALTIIHGVRDAWVPVSLSRAIADELGGRSTALELVELRATGHAMLRRAHTWHVLAAEAVTRLLADALASAGEGGMAARSSGGQVPTPPTRHAEPPTDPLAADDDDCQPGRSHL